MSLAILNGLIFQERGMAIAIIIVEEDGI